MPFLRAKDFPTGQPITLALDFLNAIAAPSSIPGKSECKFSTSIGTWYLADEPARDIETQIRALQVQAHEPVQIVRIATTHNQHRWHVQRPQQPMRQIEESLTQRATRELLAEANAGVRPIRAHENRVAHNTAYREGGTAVGLQQPTAAERADQQPDSTPRRQTPAMQQMCAAMCAAVDAVIETQAYAARQGLGLTFSEESVRCIGLSVYIGQQRQGGCA